MPGTGRSCPSAVVLQTHLSGQRPVRTFRLSGRLIEQLTGRIKGFDNQATLRLYRRLAARGIIEVSVMSQPELTWGITKSTPVLLSGLLCWLLLPRYGTKRRGFSRLCPEKSHFDSKAMLSRAARRSTSCSVTGPAILEALSSAYFTNSSRPCNVWC